VRSGGPDWEWGTQGGDGIGTIIGTGSMAGWVRVRWEADHTQNEYRVGGQGSYDLVFAVPFFGHHGVKCIS
jgi:hypothetical protein